MTMDDSIKRWTAKRTIALVVEIIQGKTTMAEASRANDVSPSKIEGWVDDGLHCTNLVRDSSRESSVVAGLHEQTDTPDLEDQELAGL